MSLIHVVQSLKTANKLSLWCYWHLQIKLESDAQKKSFVSLWIVPLHWSSQTWPMVYIYIILVDSFTLTKRLQAWTFKNSSLFLPFVAQCKLYSVIHNTFLLNMFIWKWIFLDNFSAYPVLFNFHWYANWVICSEYNWLYNFLSVLVRYTKYRQSCLYIYIFQVTHWVF